jgi:ribosomal protein S1
MAEEKQRLYTAKDADDIFNLPWKSDIERIKYTTKAYKDMSIAKAFATFYGVEVSQETENSRNVNTIQVPELGEIYQGIVKSFDGQKMLFEVPGIKEELLCKENFNSCFDAVSDFIASHGDHLLFEIREKKDGRYIVSVLNAYYKLWIANINKAIAHKESIDVHIDELTKGGYICHTVISTLQELTGKEYTHSVFIPGSCIVLNIEKDFKRWEGQDVEIIPQKIVEYKHMSQGQMFMENSIIGSRKKVLQLYGQQNMSEIYNGWKLAHMGHGKNKSYKPEAFEGTVTGIINSAGKHGVFVELDGKYITGLMPMAPDRLLDYPPGTHVRVQIKEFEIFDGKEPFIYNRYTNAVIKCNTRVVFEFAKQ